MNRRRAQEKENKQALLPEKGGGAAKVTSPSVLRQLLKDWGLHPCRARGQHFLVDENILGKILHAAALNKEDLAIDIGAGPGALSLAMAPQVKEVIAIEQDRGLAAFLREQGRLKNLDNLTVIEADVRRLDLASLWRQPGREYPPGQEGVQKGVKVVANLPYYLTTPLLFQILQGKWRPSLLVLMVQLEVARRILAEPGSKDYGALTVLCRYYCRSSFLFKVSRHVFYPPPAVDSAVILLEALPCPSVAVPDEALFWSIVRAAFQKRRKTALNALELVQGRRRREWELILKQAGIAPERRGETLSPSEFAKLAELLYNI